MTEKLNSSVTQGDSEEALDSEERLESMPLAAQLSYFGSDFDVHGLVRRLGKGDIVVPSFEPDGSKDTDLEGFQRQFVWRPAQKAKFIESLLLGYPVPGIFLVQQEDRKLLVLDGQQRLMTLALFYENKLPLPDSVAAEFRGLTYDALTSEQRRALDNTFIHATIVKHDEAAKNDDAIYQVFERLNTGGTALAPHEVRVALYPGEFVRFLRDLNQDTNWRELFGPPSTRLRDQELILRFIAFQARGDQYKRPLKKFLNDFVKDHRDLQGIDAQRIRTHFASVCSLLKEGIGRRAFRAHGNQLNAALAEAVMCAVWTRLEAGEIKQIGGLDGAYDLLVAEEDFIEAVERATADEEQVRTRLRLATAAFAKVK